MERIANILDLAHGLRLWWIAIVITESRKCKYIKIIYPYVSNIRLYSQTQNKLFTMTIVKSVKPRELKNC